MPSEDDDLDRELRSHLEAEAEEQRQNGRSPEEAHFLARRALGNTTAIKEAVHGMSTALWLEGLQADVKYALRGFGRSPGFTAVIVLTLALGIGLTTAMFSIVEAVLLNPLPYPHADRLVVVWQKLTAHPENPPVFDSYRDFETWRRESHSFEELAPATWATGGQILTGAGPARHVLAMPVGMSFFKLLGEPPQLGRAFQPGDIQRGCLVVLKHDFWVQSLGGQNDVVGRHIKLDEKACTVIGVMPAGFTFYPDALAMWMLITPDSQIARDPENASVGVFGRLKPGVPIAQAENEVRSIFKNLHRNDPNMIGRLPFVYPLAEQFAYLSGPNLRLTVVVLFAAVLLVLLIACLNIANLLLGRALARQKEIAVRAALGSGRLRLIRQLLTEGLLLSFSGAVPGALLAIGAVHLFRILNPIQMPPGNPVTVNLPVLVFTCTLAVGTAFVFALLPAIRASRVNLAHAFRAGSRSATPGARRQALAKALVAAEVMLSSILLAGAGLLIASVNHLLAVPLGFSIDHVVSASFTLPPASYATADGKVKFYREALERTSRLPGIESAALASALPLGNGRWGGNALVSQGDAEPTPANAVRDVAAVSISPGYFHVMKVPLQLGRDIDNKDRKGTEEVAIVNRELASRYFHDQSPVGRKIRIGEPGTERPWLTIVGVTGNEKDKDFFHEMSWQNVPTVFRPVDQSPPQSCAITVRTSEGNASAGTELQKTLAAIDSAVAIGDVETLTGQLSHIVAYPRFRATLFAIFAGVALSLAAIGLYGVLSQFASQRTMEFGVRLALGARSQDLLTLVLRQGLFLVLTGMVGGLMAAVVLTKFLGSMLSGVKAGDPWTFAAVAMLLMLVACLAMFIPASKAARTEPAVTLRYE